MPTLKHNWVNTVISYISLVDKPEIYIGRIYINSPYSNYMDRKWQYDGGNGYILILKYESFKTESCCDFVTVSVWHYFHH
jgi:hypothetical protein